MVGKNSALSFRITIWSCALLFGTWWIAINFIIRNPDPNNNLNQAFAALYGIVALLAGAIGLAASRKWGGRKSLIGRALLFFALGALAQEFGQLAYSFYLYALKVPIPYPSIGDIGYFGSVLFYIYAAWQLARAAGAHFSLKVRSKQLVAIILPAALLVASYLLFLRGYQFDFSSPQAALTVLLDFGYPLGQASYIAIALVTFLVSKGLLGGVMKNKILLLLFALLMQYIADISFLFAAKDGTFVTAGINDFLYLVSYTVMAFALSTFLTLKIATRTERVKE